LALQGVISQPKDANPIDPRHHFDNRCPAAAKIDPEGQERDPTSSSSYLSMQLSQGASIHDCAVACCHDWSCEAFAFYKSLPKAQSNCTESKPCCIFKDDIDALVTATSGAQTGVRQKLPAVAPPYPRSTKILNTVVDPHLIIGINGDEFPITWGQDGNQYTGAGDNHQMSPNGTRLPSSPLSFFKVSGGPTQMGCNHPATHHDQPAPSCANISQQGTSVPVQGPAVSKACPAWRDGIPNLKSSGVLSVDGVLYWAVSCFNYGDDPVFNRQRYGPAWIITSADNGVTWNLTATPTGMFPGRLAAPRFIQYGKDNSDAPDDWVYVYFPGTTSGSAFFENNDEVLLARVDKSSILNREAYQFYNGQMLDGTTAWTTDSTIATPIWQFPLMTSVQQANYHPTLKRYIWANWAWISYDGYPRPDHTADERNDRTGHQRTQLLLIEGPNPWGPFSVFHQDDDWSGSDGSSGGYTPVIPPAWVGHSDFWLVFTQCCGNPRPPLNNYNFNAEHITFQATD